MSRIRGISPAIYKDYSDIHDTHFVISKWEGVENCVLPSAASYNLQQHLSGK